MNGSQTPEARFAAAWNPLHWRDLTVILAISGGADSVALLRLATAVRDRGRGQLIAAHFNHQLRGDESRADQDMVQRLCRQLDVPCTVGTFARTDTTPPEGSNGGEGPEATARGARYAFLHETAARCGARYVVTAHTADDQAETILHRILRGTGIGGLSGMRRARALDPCTTLLRPLLSFHHQELVAYLQTIGQPYREDSSNRDPRFTRNRIRHELLPLLARQFNADVGQALLRLGTLAGEAQGVIDVLVEELLQRCVTRDEPAVLRIDLAELASRPRYLVRELLMAVWKDRRWPMQSMGFAQWESLAAMAMPDRDDSPCPACKQTFPGAILAEVVGGRLVLRQG
ncbi:MAG: tRNA lysidine(34) synthetase TilS [Planctomycetes bacterium]|nr:tRNA lysidine(34) synthetase TilS [Planctomycetota bacterium]